MTDTEIVHQRRTRHTQTNTRCCFTSCI